jgi:hypothetical protein
VPDEPDGVSIPEWLMREVLDPVLADLQQPRAVDLVVEMQPGGWVTFSERGQPGGFGLGVPDPATPRAALMSDWADQLQEQFFPETQAVWGEARPARPGHPHPAQAIEHDGGAWWMCPNERRLIARIGQLHHDRRP